MANNDKPPEQSPLTKEELNQMPLSPNELAGLRAILDRHGFDREKGTF